MNTYGAGCWSDWWCFYPPLTFTSTTFAQQAADALDTYRELRDDFPEFYPLAAWPEPGGLLPFANSVEGDVFGWLVEGRPDDWPVILSPRSGDQPPPFSGSLVDTLLDWLRGRLHTDGLVDLYYDFDDPLDFIAFQSWSDQS